jgi:hypothetical protein
MLMLGKRRVRVSKFAISGLSILVCACSVPNGTNINYREDYWKAEIAKSLSPGATRADLERFAQARGEQLHCYQNHKQEDQCDISDRRSAGGTSNLPMRLVVIFEMKDGKYTAPVFTTEHVEPQ